MRFSGVYVCGIQERRENGKKRVRPGELWVYLLDFHWLILSVDTGLVLRIFTVRVDQNCIGDSR